MSHYKIEIMYCNNIYIVYIICYIIIIIFIMVHYLFDALLIHDLIINIIVIISQQIIIVKYCNNVYNGIIVCVIGIFKFAILWNMYIYILKYYELYTNYNVMNIKNFMNTINLLTKWVINRTVLYHVSVNGYYTIVCNIFLVLIPSKNVSLNTYNTYVYYMFTNIFDIYLLKKKKKKIF